MQKSLLFICALLLVGQVHAESVDELVSALGDDQKRADAIQKLLTLGGEAESPLRKYSQSADLKPRQSLIVRRLLGDLQIKRTPLAPIDLSRLVPMGEKKDADIFIDPNKKLIVVKGEFVIAGGLLEYLVASFKPAKKLHESIIGVTPTAGELSAAMIARDFGWSGEIDEDGKVALPKDTGVTVSVEFEWETPHAAMDVRRIGADGKPVTYPPGEKKWVRVPIEYFAWNTQTNKPMRCVPFAFNGSKTCANPWTGRSDFMADATGSVLAAKLDAYALMNSPLDTHSINPQVGEAGYVINKELIPVPGAKCRVVLEQYTGIELTDADLKDSADARNPGK